MAPAGPLEDYLSPMMARQPRPLDPLTSFFDYAGLFPPAGLPMAAAVANYADYRRSADRWALGRFVAPAARLAELTVALVGTSPAGWAGARVSSVVGSDSQADVGQIDDFNRQWAAADIQVDVAEAKVATVDEIDRLRRQLPTDLIGYVEIPLSEPRKSLLARLAELGLRAKIRMGGIVPEAFPAADLVAGFLLDATAIALPFKATAGLHHPLRGSYALTYAERSPVAPMYGFLNLMVATLLARVPAPRDVVVEALTETDPGAIRWDEGGLRWRETHFDSEQLAALRRAFNGIGSCSFREPMDELEPVLSP